MVSISSGQPSSLRQIRFRWLNKYEVTKLKEVFLLTEYFKFPLIIFHGLSSQFLALTEVSGLILNNSSVKPPGIWILFLRKVYSAPTCNLSVALYLTDANPES